MNETNRTAIILLAGLWIVLMGVVVFLTWAAPDDSVDQLMDMVEFMQDHQDEEAARLILSLGALLLVVLALLVIIVEVAPEDETRELRVEQAGSTTIVPAEALRLRLEQALVGLPQVTAAKARVFSRDKGIGSSLDLTIAPDANVAAVTQEASRVVVDTLQTDLGLPASGLPTVRIVFGGPKAEPVASSIVQPPAEELPPATSPEVPTAESNAAGPEATPAPERPVDEEAPGEPQP